MICSNRDLSGRNYATVDVIRVKNASDPLNVDSVLLAAAHPSFFRFHVFSAFLRRPVCCSGGLGRAAHTPPGLRGDIHVEKVFTKQDAERVVRAELDKRSARAGKTAGRMAHT